jgi:hypothetical protein
MLYIILTRVRLVKLIIRLSLLILIDELLVPSRFKRHLRCLLFSHLLYLPLLVLVAEDKYN